MILELNLDLGPCGGKFPQKFLVPAESSCGGKRHKKDLFRTFWTSTLSFQKSHYNKKSYAVKTVLFFPPLDSQIIE